MRLTLTIDVLRSMTSHVKDFFYKLSHSQYSRVLGTDEVEDEARRWIGALAATEHKFPKLDSCDFLPLVGPPIENLGSCSVIRGGGRLEGYPLWSSRGGSGRLPRPCLNKPWEPEKFMWTEAINTLCAPCTKLPYNMSTMIKPETGSFFFF